MNVNVPSDRPPGSNGASARGDPKLSALSPGLRILFPHAKKAKVLPWKGSGKHKYSFARQGSLPLDTLYSSLEYEHAPASVSGPAEALVVVKDSGTKGSSRQHAKPSAPEHALSGEALEESLKQERQRQLDILAKLFSEEVAHAVVDEEAEDQDEKGTDNVGTELRDSDMVKQATFNYAAGLETLNVLPPKNSSKDSEEGELVDADSVPPSAPSPWDRLFEAAAGVGVAEDISDSETSDLMVDDAPTEEGTLTEDAEPAAAVTDAQQAAKRKRKVSWEDMQDGEAMDKGRKKRRKDRGDHVTEKSSPRQSPQGEEEDEVTVGVATKPVFASKAPGDVPADAKMRKGSGFVAKLASSKVPPNAAAAAAAAGEAVPGKAKGKRGAKGRKDNGAVAEESAIETGCGVSGDSRKDKWKRMFEAAAEGLPDLGAQSDATEVGRRSTPQDQGQSEANRVSVSGKVPETGGVESKEQRWKKMFEAASSGFEPTGLGSSTPSREEETEGDVVVGSPLDHLPRVTTVSKRKSKAKSSSSLKVEDRDRNSVKETGVGAEHPSSNSSSQCDPNMMMLPQRDAKAAAEKSCHSSGPEVDAGICCRMESDPADSVNEKDRVSLASSNLEEAHDAPLAPADVAPTAGTSVSAPRTQKASWRSLVGENGVVGFSLASTFSLDLAQQNPPPRSVLDGGDNQVAPSTSRAPVDADKTEHRKALTAPVQASSDAVGEAAKGSIPKRTVGARGQGDAKGGDANTTELTPGGLDPGEQCTFMRSESAYRDWVTSKAKLRGDCKAKHKAAKRQIRRMRPPRKI